MNVSTASSTTISSIINAIPNAIVDVSNPIQGSPYFDFAGMDTNINPADDFYSYASGTWMKNTEIPDENSIWGTFPILRKKVTDDLLQIIHSVDGTKSHEEFLCNALYKSAMNIQLQNDTGLQPIQETLDKIDKVESITSFIEVLADLLKLGLNAFCSWNIEADPCDNKFIIIHLSDGGLALPNFEMYLKEKDTQSNKHEEKREKYKLFIDDLFQMAKINVENPSVSVMKIETALASAFLTKADGSNPDKTTNIQAPAGCWRQIFEYWGISDLTTSINVKNVKLLQTIEGLFENEILSDLKTYLKFTVLKRFSPKLGESFNHLYFNFFSKELLGTKEQKPLDIRMCEMINHNLASALGKIYVEKHFPASKKEKVIKMVSLVKQAFIEKIETLDWMQEATKETAIKKIKKMVVEIGYPDDEHWKSYKDLMLDEKKSYCDNIIEVKKFDFKCHMKKLAKGLNDKKEWEISPQTVNAFNKREKNKITLPAGIFQNPFFTDDDATTWGAFGMVIAHEITHSFDNIGKKYDERGNLANWWLPQDDRAYGRYAEEIVEQFNGYSVTFEDGTADNVNGELTLSENIADLGGLKIAFKAMQKMNYGEVDGLSPEKRFFLGYAQIWRKKARPSFEKQQLRTDFHSPALWRVNGTLSQMKEFKDAFNLPDDCKMVIPENRQSKMWG